MIRQRYKDEFEIEGVEAVRKQVERGSYTEQGKTEQAIKWLNQTGFPTQNVQGC
jgi:type III secretory pathway lipoprotein EscJ